MADPSRTNADLARLFDEMSHALELQGANRFRVIAHSKVADAIRDLADDVVMLARDPKALAAIDGIGDKTVKKILEWVERGAISEHEKLLDEVPRGLFDVMKISGVGPKTTKLLWEQAGVIDLPSLKAAIDAGKLEGIPRMGAKTIANMKEAIAFAEKAGQRARLGKAWKLAEALRERLLKVPGVKCIEVAGSTRRGRETIGDIDLLAVADDPEALSGAFRHDEDVDAVLVAGSTKSSVRTDAGIQVDLRVVPEASFGAALMYFSGSKAHNVILRERAVKAGFRLNEYGLFPDDGNDEPPQNRGVEPVAGATENEVYTALGLPYIPPEMREDRGELDLETVPELIELDDVKSELHSHTVASDGHLSIEAMAKIAKARGFHTLAITDHSKSSVQANGLSEERLRAHIAAIREVDAKLEGIRVLAGAEVDILVDGTLDYDDDLLAELDVVVASPHASLAQDRATAMKRLLAAVTHPRVHIIGHPTGRVVNRRGGLDLDLPTLAAAAAEHGTALEINANPFRLDLRDIHVRAALDAGALIAIDTDAHRETDFDHLRFGVMTGRRGWLTKDRCVNAWGAKRLHAWLKDKGREAG